MQIVDRGFILPLLVGAALLAAPDVSGAQRALQSTDVAANAKAATVQIRALNARGQAHSSGSGFLVSGDGTIVTNFHVIDGAERLEVELPDGEIYTNVYFVNSDPRRDLAVLKVPADRLVSLRLGDDTGMAVGARVYAMGNPLGQTATFSDGMVSAHRTIEGVAMLQITAPISSGSSGGPVMNEAGEVIGVATMILQGGQNLNYAVPARYVRPLLAMGDRPRPFSASLLPRETGGLAAVGNSPTRGRTAPAPTPPRARSTSAPSGDVHMATVMEQIRNVEAVFESEYGVTRSHDVGTGSLRENQSETKNIRLDGGVTYALVGVCDTDCSDLDLRLYNAAGTLLESDLRVSDMPFIVFRPRVSGVYRIKVTMSDCSAAPCRYGVASFSEQ